MYAFLTKISTICNIYQKEQVRSYREIAIKEDLELYEELHNKDRLISSLRSSPLLEFSDPRKSPQKNIRKGDFPGLINRKVAKQSETDYLAKIKDLYA